jgi:hypothetical protein
MRDLVRVQLDVDEEDLPNVLLDTYLQTGYDLAIGLEHRWPFFEATWPITVAADAAGRATLPTGVRVIEMLFGPDGQLLRPLTVRQATMTYPPGGSANVGSPAYWTEYGGQLIVMPTPSSDFALTALGYRAQTDWISLGAGSECDCDQRLHIPICWYACSLAYAQQEDEVLEVTYLNRYKETVSAARDAIMRAWTGAPKQVGYVDYPPMVSGPGGPAAIIINTPAVP